MTIKVFTVNLFIFIGILIPISCNDSSNKKNITEEENKLQKKIEPINVNLNIQTFPANKLEYVVGESPKLYVSQIDSTMFDSIQFFFADEFIQTVTKLPFETELTKNINKTGRSNFEAKIFANNSMKTQNQTYRFLSDITPKNYSYEVIRVYPHDKKAFTQGLVYDNGFFYEATGLKGASSLRKVQVGTGDIIQSFTIAPEIFGEGITIFGDKIIQLSWQARVGFVYDKSSFQLLAKFNYSTEGWGLTNDGKHLIMSDGSNKIYFLDNQTYSEVSRIEVYDNKGPVNQLNELEFIDGEIYANIYQTDKIARIDPFTGKVLSYIDLTGILPKKDYDNDTDVLNGIAYDSTGKKLFVTGKKWPKLFEIKLK